MGNNEGIKRIGDFKYDSGDFRCFRVQGMYMNGKLGRNATDACAWLENIGLIVRYSERKVALVTVETVASAVVEMARDLPAMREALIESLTAMRSGGGMADEAALKEEVRNG